MKVTTNMSHGNRQHANRFPVVIDDSVAVAPSTHGNRGAPDGPPLVFEVIKKRWWLCALCVIAAGAAAYLIADELGTQSAEVRGSLMYTGLPVPAGPQVYQAPSLMTYREILFSTPMMQRICDQHGLRMPPKRLAESYDVSVRRNSVVMEVTLSWANPSDGIMILNDTMQLLIDEAARQRKELLREYMKQVELDQLSAKNEADVAVRNLRSARQRRDELLNAGGLTGNKYSSLLEQTATTQTAIDSVHVNQLGVQQQMKRISTNAQSLIDLLIKHHVEKRKKIVRDLIKPYSKDSDKWTELRKVYLDLQRVASSERPTMQTYMEWKSKLAEIGPGMLPANSTFETEEIKQLESDLRSLQSNREKLELELIPMANQLDLLQKRRQQYEAQATELAGDITGIAQSDFEDYEKQVEVAESRLRRINQQLESMRQLEQYRTTEFTVLMPASMETAELSSNKKKLFVLVAFALSAALCAPVFGLEWLMQREGPVARFAGRWGLPVIAERLLSNYSPRNRKPADWRLDDAIRMATLRIQQSMGSSGGVVLVSGLGNTTTPVTFISAIAECLAQREERVLLVDAIDPSSGRSRLSSTNTSTEKKPKPRLLTRDAKLSHHGEHSDKPSGFGLSEYLSRECEGVTDLIQPTACPGVDLISSGGGRFPAEAMASSCITELFQYCRQTYSMILVAGPPALARADFQMLAARADAILLAADRASIKDPANREVVQDLIDLRAPLIGIVA